MDKNFIQGLSPKVRKYVNDNMPEPNKFLVFKLVNADRIDETVKIYKGSRGNHTKAKNANSKTYVGYENFYDSGVSDIGEREKVIKYITGRKTVVRDGKNFIEDNIGDIEFNNRGVAIARGSDVTKCIYMLLSGHCKNNPFRTGSGLSAEWYLVKKDSEIDGEEFGFEMIDYAVSRNEVLSHEDRLAAAEYLANKGHQSFMNKGSDLDHPKYLKTLVRRFIDAQEGAESFLVAIKDKKAMKKIQMKQAFKDLFLKFESGSRSWYLEDSNGEVICDRDGGQMRIEVTNVEDKWEKIGKVLSSNAKLGKNFYQALTQLLVSGEVIWLTEDKEVKNEHDNSIPA